MSTTRNPFKKSTTPLVDQLAAKQAEFEAKQADKAEEAASLAELAAEAAAESKVAASHASAVDAAFNILAKAGVAL